MDEIKEWEATNYRATVCSYLMLNKVAFSYSEESGLIFTAPDSFVGYSQQIDPLWII